MSGNLAYFHGLPGGPGEWSFFAPQGLHASAWLPDRNRGGEVDGEFLARFPAGGAHLVGFSLGAPIALRLAARYPDRVERITLVSPGAPLQLGDFLSQMAGGPLFRMAAQSPRLFAAVAGAERLLARAAPAFLADRLFASAAGEDAALARDPAFRSAMAGVLRQGLGASTRGFVDEVAAYVADWRAVLCEVRAPVTIWQGNADNWTPPAMARALAAALPGEVDLREIEGTSHYSTLARALAELAA